MLTAQATSPHTRTVILVPDTFQCLKALSSQDCNATHTTYVHALPAKRACCIPMFCHVHSCQLNQHRQAVLMFASQLGLIKFCLPLLDVHAACSELMTLARDKVVTYFHAGKQWCGKR